MGIGRTISVFVVLLGACGMGAAQEVESQAVVQGTAADGERAAMPEAARLGALPASFEGQVPAADGPRIHYQLNLFPGRVFVLRMTEPGREDEPLDQIGTWAVSADGGRLMLNGAATAPRLFSVGDMGTLHMLDPAGGQIESPSSYDLTRVDPFVPVEPRLLLGGMYEHAGKAGVFQECRTGWRLPVAREGENEAMESAYAGVSRGTGEPLLVSLVGKIVPRPRTDGEGTQMVLVPERFIGLWPGETCGLHRP